LETQAATAAFSTWMSVVRFLFGNNVKKYRRLKRLTRGKFFDNLHCQFRHTYLLYIIPLIGITHILGGVGPLIPNVPRLTEWVYAGFAFTLLLAFYSQLNGGGSTWDKFDPILVMAFVIASYVLRRCMRTNKWSI